LGLRIYHWTLGWWVSARVLTSLKCGRIIAVRGIVLFFCALGSWQFACVLNWILIYTTGAIIIIERRLSNLSRWLHWLYTLDQFLGILEFLIFHNSTSSRHGTDSRQWSAPNVFDIDNWLVFISAWSLLRLSFISIHHN